MGSMMRNEALSAADAVDAMLAIQTSYLAAAQIAEARGLDPDVPRHLAKVTRPR